MKKNKYKFFEGVVKANFYVLSQLKSKFVYDFVYRSEVVTVKVSSPNVKVFRVNNIEGDDEEEMIPCQLSPVFDDLEGQIANNEFQLSFLAQAKGFALQTYYIQLMRPEEGSNTCVKLKL